MKRFGRTGSTFTTIVAAVVLIAVASTSGAVAGGLITSKQIKNNTIKSKDVHDGTLKSVDVADGSLGSADITNGSLSAGDFTSAPAGIARGYVWSGTASPTTGVAIDLTSSPYAFNSAGGAITRTKTATGVYTVTFAGLDLNAGNVQVTGYGSGEGAVLCKTSGWGASTVGVVCFDDTGAATDSRFSLAFIR